MAHDSNSPNSGFNSGYSDHSHQYFVPPSEFRNPFSEAYSDSPTSYDPRKMPPTNAFVRASGMVFSTSDGLGSPSWAAPDSWAANRGHSEYYNLPELSEGYETESDNANTPTGWVSGKTRPDDRSRRRARSVVSASFSSMTTVATRGCGTSRHLGRVHAQVGVSRHRDRPTRHCDESDGNAEQKYRAERRLGTAFSERTRSRCVGCVLSRPCLTLFMSEWILGPNEKPAVVKLRMEQVGYECENGAHFGTENLSILLKFVYKAQLSAGVSYPAP